jgi:ADP-heptose:LPS heptosyltransferase
MQRILLIRLSAVGDVINTLPALSLLRKALPQAHLAFLVEDRARELLIGHPLLDAVYVFPRRQWRDLLRSPDPRSWRSLRSEASSYARELREAHFDVTLDFQGNLKGALHARLSGAPRRIGFARGHGREMSHWFATEHVEPPADRPHRVDKFVALLGPLGIDGANDEREFVLPPAPGACARITAFLAAARLGRRALVSMHPGTSARGRGKRWPAERFGALAAQIADEADTVVTWGPGEQDLADAVVAASGRPDAVRAGPAGLSLLELAELVRVAAVFVSADTGPMHLAAACGTRCVALFGPKDPAVYQPYGRGHHVLHHPDRDGSPGMLRIGTDEVAAAVRAALAGRAA